jgi:hypothetical protein
MENNCISRSLNVSCYFHVQCDSLEKKAGWRAAVVAVDEDGKIEIFYGNKELGSFIQRHRGLIKDLTIKCKYLYLLVTTQDTFEASIALFVSLTIKHQYNSLSLLMF